MIRNEGIDELTIPTRWPIDSIHIIQHPLIPPPDPLFRVEDDAVQAMSTNSTNSTTASRHLLHAAEHSVRLAMARSTSSLVGEC
jgi:hypothetical protein